MIALLLLVAAFAGVEVVVTDGPLRPARASVLEVAATLEDGRPDPTAPRLDVVGGTVKGPVAARPGVWRWQLVPAADAAEVEVRVGAVTRRFPSAPPPPSTLEVPETVDALAKGDPPAFVVRGPDLPPIDALHVVASEGRVAAIRAVEDGIEVVLEPDDLPYPRWIPVAVRDTRRDEAPAWTRVRLRARPPIALRSEPGATLTLEVGGRSYGPFTAAEDGSIDGRFDHYPGEVLATALLVDDLGNETRSGIPLVTQTAPALVLVPTGEILPGRPPPLVHVRAVGPDGRAPERPPTCRTPSAALAVRAAGDASVVAIPARDPPEDVRLVCTSGGTTAPVRVPVSAGVPRDLDLRVWPEELVTDFPTAEVRVALEDVRGDSMPVDGVLVDAARGEITLEPGGGLVVRGEYDGSGAIEAGEDRVRARWLAPAGRGPVEEVVLRWGDVPRGAGSLPVHARALDAMRHPLAGVELTITAGTASAQGITGPDGWTSALLSIEPRGPLVVGASSRWRRATALVLPAEAASGTPGTADLQVVRSLRIRPGRVAGISIAVEPQILRAGPGAVAWVYVALEDGAGQPITDEPPEVEVSEGTIGTLEPRPDGTFVAEYTPLPIDAPRDVRITARTDTVRTSASLHLEPKVVRVSIGPWVGGTTNFGEATGFAVGGDLDVRIRTRLLGEGGMLRLGVARTSFSTTERTVAGLQEFRNVLVPIWAAVLFRQDRGPFALWGGLGGEVIVHRLVPDPGVAGTYWLGGPAVLGGLGRRALGGELVGTVRGSWVPANEPLGYTTNLGGLTAGLGYRLVY